MRLVSAIRYCSARALRRALLRCIGGIFLITSAGFLTAAAWIVLEQAYSALAAALVIGCFYLGLGLIFLAVAASSRHSRADAAELAALRDPAMRYGSGVMSPLAEAFIIGLNAAYAARRRR